MEFTFNYENILARIFTQELIQLRFLGESGELERCFRYSDLNEFMDGACLMVTGRLLQNKWCSQVCKREHAWPAMDRMVDGN